LFRALDNRSKFAGAVQAGWRAYDITSDAASGLGAWSDQELSQFLSSGHAHLHGTASGPMGEAVDKSLRFLTQADIASIVAYLRSVPPIANADLPRPKENIATAATAADPLGKRIFEGACASCHGWAGESPVMPFASFVGARAVNDPSAINVAQIVLSGTQRQTPSGIATMPAFGHAYSDAEIASVANYVTTAFGAVPSAIAAADIAKLRKMQ
jgi:mono/diheme cytochrome c family protein